MSNYTAFTYFFIKEKKEKKTTNKTKVPLEQSINFLVLTDQIKSHDVNRKRNSDKGINMQTFWITLTGSFTIYVYCFPHIEHATGETPESRVSGTGEYSANMKFCLWQMFCFVMLC